MVWFLVLITDSLNKDKLCYQKANHNTCKKFAFVPGCTCANNTTLMVVAGGALSIPVVGEVVYRIDSKQIRVKFPVGMC